MRTRDNSIQHRVLMRGHSSLFRKYQVIDPHAMESITIINKLTLMRKRCRVQYKIAKRNREMFNDVINQKNHELWWVYIERVNFDDNSKINNGNLDNNNPSGKSSIATLTLDDITLPELLDDTSI
ncbi:hypothetical protein PV327_003638 [Microctonus hyperodae]|uniref:Uncharacterized protein n=1 Tax=Microctonus hyperodae TaxID=165561 RepID=A0AA39L1E1_MICHY|nr:hypothetical protein PV327_003638 [Microctonus hyperodae]